MLVVLYILDQISGITNGLKHMERSESVGAFDLHIEPLHVISNNVAFRHEQTQTCLFSLILSSETPNPIRPVAMYSLNLQATSKGSDQCTYAQAGVHIVL